MTNIERKFNEYIRKQIRNVRKNPEKSRQRLETARGILRNYLKLKSLSDIELRLANSQNKTILAELNDPVYRKLQNALFRKGAYESEEQREHVLDRVLGLMRQVEKREMASSMYETLNIEGVASPKDITQVLKKEHKDKQEREAINY